MSVDTPTLPRSRTQSLNDVRAIIPEACYRRSAWRGSLALAQAALLYFVPLTLLALTNTWWALALLWPLAGLGAAGLFVLGHDASHQALFDSRRANRLAARAAMVPALHAEAAWDLGHNRVHHGYTTRQGFDFVWHPSTVEQYQAMGRFARLQHRIEWSCLGSGAYFMREVWWNKMWKFSAPGKRHDDIQRDKIWVATVAGAAIAGSIVLGALTSGLGAAIWMPFKLFIIPFLLFIHVIGWAVYVHHVAPEIRWWDRKEWTQFRGQMESTTILHINPVVNKLYMHNIMVHVPHHVDQRIPFHQLTAAADAISAAFPGIVRTSKFRSRDYLRTTKTCKLYDFANAQWLPYSAAKLAPTVPAAAGAAAITA